MSSLLDIPEIVGLDTKRSLVRIPPELDVPLTPRVRQLIDTPEFRRLSMSATPIKSCDSSKSRLSPSWRVRADQEPLLRR